MVFTTYRHNHHGNYNKQFPARNMHSITQTQASLTLWRHHQSYWHQSKHWKLSANTCSRQWGFMSNRSTVSALIRVMDDWLSAIGQGNEVCVVFLDISKAFDTVPHLALLHKLSELGLDPYLLRWIRSYLSGRFQFVAVDGFKSYTLPACSFWLSTRFSPWATSVYILYKSSDVATTISPDSDVNMFADDIALYCIIRSVSDYMYLQMILTPFLPVSNKNIFSLMLASADWCSS